MTVEMEVKQEKMEVKWREKKLRQGKRVRKAGQGQ